MRTADGSNSAALPRDEQQRIELLRSLCVLDTPPEPMFDDLTALAAAMFHVPIVLITLIDEHRQFFKSVVGLPLRETSRNLSFCAHALLTDKPLIIPDTQVDERFRENPFVTGEPHVRFYAGAPLVSKSGIKLGIFCIIDRKLRPDFDPEHFRSLQRFASHATQLIDQRLLPGLVQQAESEKQRLESRMHDVLESTRDGVILLDARWQTLYRNRRADEIFLESAASEDGSLWGLFPASQDADAWRAMVETSMRERVEASFEGDLASSGRRYQVQLYPTMEGLAAFFRNVTEIRRMQSVAQRDAQRFRHLVHSISELVWFNDDDQSAEAGQLEWMKFSGQTFAETENLGWLARVHPEDRGAVRNTWLVCEREKRPYSSLLRVLDKDGIFRRMRSNAYPVLKQNGDLQGWIGIYTDLTERETAEAALRAANERFVLATRASADGIWDMDAASEIVFYSARWRSIFGWPEQDVSGSIRDWLTLIHPKDREQIRLKWKETLLSAKNTIEVEFRCAHTDGSWRWILVRAICLRGVDGSLLRITGSACDITSQKSLDPITGLQNRASMLDQVQGRLDRSTDEACTFGVLFVDIDSFRHINESMGHRKGDALLAEIARRLEHTVKHVSGNVVARMGGDEFGILLDGIANEEDARIYLSAIEYLFKVPFDGVGEQIYVSASIGIAVGSQGAYLQAEQMLEDAEVAMHRAKLAGRSQNAVYSVQMRADAVERMSLENDLRVALHRQEFELFYQSKVSLHSREIVGFEALVRWRHPRRGLLAPASFIPVAEELGLIQQLGRWAAHTAIQQMSRWRREGRVGSSAMMAINLSAAQLSDSLLLDFLKSELLQADLTPSCLVLEITESIFVDDTPERLLLLQNIASSGIGLALDDFGTGYSSLSYLHRFPFCAIKIDRGFVGRLEQEPKCVELVASILALARSLELTVVAEGVETESQAASLIALGCKYGQGFLFSTPQAAHDLEETHSGLMPKKVVVPLRLGPAA